MPPSTTHNFKWTEKGTYKYMKFNWCLPRIRQVFVRILTHNKFLRLVTTTRSRNTVDIEGNPRNSLRQVYPWCPPCLLLPELRFQAAPTSFRAIECMHWIRLTWSTDSTHRWPLSRALQLRVLLYFHLTRQLLIPVLSDRHPNGEIPGKAVHLRHFKGDGKADVANVIRWIVYDVCCSWVFVWKAVGKVSSRSELNPFGLIWSTGKQIEGIWWVQCRLLWSNPRMIQEKAVDIWIII